MHIVNIADIVADYIKRMTGMKPTKFYLCCRNMTLVI